MVELPEEVRKALSGMVVWVITGVTGFLAWNVWHVALSVERLTVVMQQSVLNDTEFSGDIKSLRNELKDIRGQLRDLK